MKAVVLRIAGSPEALQVEEWPDPKAEPSQVLLRVLACGVCNHDVLVRSLGLPRKAFHPPQILGHEICGEILQVGKEVTGFRVGDRVATLNYSTCLRCEACLRGEEPLCPSRRLNGGGYAEYVALDPSALVPVPARMPADQGAILSCAIGIALRAVRETAAIRQGETVLVAGAGGGIGAHSVQFARLFGGRVIALTSSRHKVEKLKGLGADEVVQTGEGGFHDEVLAVTGGKGVDVVLDHLGSPVFRSAFRCLANKGRYIFIGEVASGTIEFSAAWMFRKDLTLRGSGPARRRDVLEALRLVEEGEVKPTVGHKLPLQQASLAHALMESKESFGRVVLLPQELA